MFFIVLFLFPLHPSSLKDIHFALRSLLFNLSIVSDYVMVLKLMAVVSLAESLLLNDACVTEVLTCWGQVWLSWPGTPLHLHPWAEVWPHHQELACHLETLVQPLDPSHTAATPRIVLSCWMQIQGDCHL